jgi:LacI family transcriptional regulator
MRNQPLPKLGLVTNNPQEVFQRNVIAGVNAIAKLRGYKIIVFTVPEGKKPDFSINELSGLLVIANVLSGEFLRDLYQRDFPLSLVSHDTPNLPIPSVSANNIQGIAILVEHLVIGCNRRRLVFIDGDMQQNDGIQRHTAFRQEVMRYNLDIPEEFFLRGDFIPSLAAEALAKLIQVTTDFDGLIASDYLMALAAIEVLEAHDLHVPDHVAVVGFGGGPEADAAGLTIVAADVVELGRRAARQLH